MVYVRRRYFKKRFNHIVEAALRRKRVNEESASTRFSGLARVLSRRRLFNSQNEEQDGPEEKYRKDKYKRFFPGAALEKLRPDMIRRIDREPQLVNPSGGVSETPFSSPRKASGNHSTLANISGSDESEPSTAAESSSASGHPAKYV